VDIASKSLHELFQAVS